MTRVNLFDPPCSDPDTIQRNNHPSTTDLGCRLCRLTCFVWLISAAILLAIVLPVGYAFKYRYDCNHISISNLKIDSITVSNFNLSSRPNQISADWNIKINLKNMDRHGYLNFSGFSVSIYYDVLQVGLSNLMPFDMTPT